MADTGIVVAQGLAALMFSWLVVTDVTERRIPNVTIVVLLILSVLLVPFSLMNVLVSIACLILGLAAYAKGWLGAGDSKLLAVCLYAAQDHWPECLLVTALSGGVLSLAYLARNRLLLAWKPAYPAVRTVPYGVAITLGALMSTPLILFP
ncbi:prepilin peptidase [Photobacterium sp. 2_MG-2023]|uniref:Prepilin peptidase n=1 Tax=Photobacterium arenosum TaxID=2774143 RepID=A0ABR9BLL0_9GAMM|nr:MULTISPECIES: prepilin peptidase [Photobacterium]MBD8513452.1 prepilin peptidase [Photobacterium arenosum]MBV7262694.1 prepilin peptidase [Photobacterium sp. WH24]MDO6582221.1 prepilin peptidase [Photobacterium sp. 2_MG-2023]